MTTSTTQTNIRPALPPSWQVMSDVCNETGRKAVAAAVGLSAAIVHKWREDRAVSGTINPLDRILAITRVTGDTRLVEWLASSCGGTFVPDVPVTEHPGEIHRATGECGVALMRALDEWAIAAADGVIEQHEAPVVRRYWDTGKSIMERVVRAGERGVYAGR